MSVLWPTAGATGQAKTYPTGVTTTTTVTADSSANTKGAYTQLVASADFDVNGIWLWASVISTNGSQMLIDLATGAAASESVVIPNIIADAPGAGTTMQGYWEFPIAIPSGTRIAARCASTTGSTTVTLAIGLLQHGTVPGATTFTNYGADTSDSGGTGIDPGATANTKGAYTQLTASSSADISFVSVQFSLKGNTVPTAAIWTVDVATGGAGSETVVIPDLRFRIPNSGVSAVGILTPRAFGIFRYIASGSRIAVRAACSTNDSTDRLFDVALVTATAPTESSTTTLFIPVE